MYNDKQEGMVYNDKQEGIVCNDKQEGIVYNDKQELQHIKTYQKVETVQILCTKSVIHILYMDYDRFCGRGAFCGGPGTNVPLAPYGIIMHFYNAYILRNLSS